MSVFDNIVVFVNELNLLPYFKNSLAKPYLETLDYIIDEEDEGELEEDDDEEEEGQEDQEEQEEGQEEQEKGQEEQEEGQEEQDDDEDLYRKFIEDEFIDNDTE